MILYLIKAYEEDIDEYDINTTSIIGIASSLEKANQMIENWVDDKRVRYVNFKKVTISADAEIPCYKIYKGIDNYNHEWSITIWIIEEELDKGVEVGTDENEPTSSNVDLDELRMEMEETWT